MWNKSFQLYVGTCANADIRNTTQTSVQNDALHWPDNYSIYTDI